MSTKRRLAKTRSRSSPLRDPGLRAKAERLLVLKADHLDAIRGGDQSFYSDGGHRELLDLLPPVYGALDVNPWDDGEEIIRAALDEANET